MTLYRVTWEIDVEADTPREAAIKARDYQTKPGTTATVFDVYAPMYEPAEPGGPSELVETVDLSSDDLVCPHCGENFEDLSLDEGIEITGIATTARQWECPCCGSWNDRNDVPSR